uniref:CHASE domain-containing protein n=1 Tax=Macrostomum lignano TaxID=282301 RepID=A0A1I8GNJ3_9PLAT
GLLFVLLTVLRESEVRHVHQEALINRLINELTGLRAEVMRLTAALDPQAAPETNFWPISSWQQYVDFVVEMPAEHLTSLAVVNYNGQHLPDRARGAGVETVLTESQMAFQSVFCPRFQDAITVIYGLSEDHGRPKFDDVKNA